MGVVQRTSDAELPLQIEIVDAAQPRNYLVVLYWLLQ